MRIKDGDGEEKLVAYGPYKLQALIGECYVITRHLHTSYPDVLKMTPLERTSLKNLLKKEFAETQKVLDSDRKKLQEELNKKKKK